MALISASDLGVSFGADVLFSGITFQIERGERWGVVGRNGTGKTTLMQLLTGAREPDRGVVARATGMRVAVMDQYRDLGGARTVWDAAARGFADLLQLEHDLGAQAHAIGDMGDRVTPEMLERYSIDLERFEHGGGYAASARVDAVLAGLGFDPVDARIRDAETLSGGERGRLALAGQLAAPADLLILDEPTNHLDLATARWLEAYLRDLDEAVLLISHDRAFLDAVVDHVLHFEGDTTNAYAGNYQRFVAQRIERRMALARAVKKQDARIAAEEDFIRRNIAGQKTSQAKGRRRRLERMPRLSPPPGEDGAMAVAFTSGHRGGDQVLATDHLMVRIGERQLLASWSGVLRRGDVVGLIGANGAGKSTLLRTLIGERLADGGTVRLTPSITVAYYRQDLGDVDPSATLYELIAARRPAWNRGQIQGHLGRFDFSGASVQRRASSLSGGERARVALALMMLQEANLLVFDEPTNHLDVESIEALEDALEDYEGTVILVTHDRALLTALATRIWSLDHAMLRDYPGGFAEWEVERTAVRPAPEAARSRTPPARQTAAPSRSDASRRRSAERALSEAEASVARCEAELQRLEDELADPALYQNAGSTVARELTAARDVARQALDRAYAAWAAAGTALDEA
ncbi:MAG TPA: ABC-F family ATP-binding cassette domain-containing protein [Gemmatimonadales bacterium]